MLIRTKQVKELKKNNWEGCLKLCFHDSFNIFNDFYNKYLSFFEQISVKNVSLLN